MKLKNSDEALKASSPYVVSRLKGGKALRPFYMFPLAATIAVVASAFVIASTAAATADEQDNNDDEDYPADRTIITTASKETRIARHNH